MCLTAKNNKMELYAQSKPDTKRWHNLKSIATKSSNNIRTSKNQVSREREIYKVDLMMEITIMKHN